MTKTPDRITNSDILKIICILMVIKIHYNCSLLPSYMDALCRIALPCFFLISGFFLSNSKLNLQHILKNLILFVVMDTLYLLLDTFILGQPISDIVSNVNPVKCLLGWPSVWNPGWFLISSVYAYFFTYFLDKINIRPLFQLLIAFILLIILWYFQRNLAFAGFYAYLTCLRALPFFIIGKIIKLKQSCLLSRGITFYVSILIFSASLIILERYILNRLLLPQPFFIYIGSPIAAICLFLLCLKLPAIKSTFLCYMGLHICTIMYCMDKAVISVYEHFNLSPGYLIIVLSVIVFSYIIYFVMKTTINLFNRINGSKVLTNIFRGLVILLLVQALLQSMISTCYAANKDTTIHASFFKNRNITSVNIGSDIENIDEDAFNNLHMLTKISVSPKNSRYSSYDNCLYNKNKTKLICFPQGLGAAKIPNTVVELSPYALKGKSAGIKKSVKETINNNKNHSVTNTDNVESSDPTSGIPNTELGFLVSDFIKSCYTENMSSDSLLRACYNQLISVASYKRFDSVYEGDWARTYATDILTSHRGNCSSYAAALAYIADAIGYDSRIVTGVVGAKSGGSTPHAWTEININGNWYIFDAELEDANQKDYYCKTYDNYPSSGLAKQKDWSVKW